MSIIPTYQVHLTVTAPRLPSPKIIQFVKSFEDCAKEVGFLSGPEGKYFKAYKPTPNDVWTCGWGTTKGVTKDTLWSQAECDAAFVSDLYEFAAGVHRLTQGFPTTQMQFDALFSFAYNCGLDEDADQLPEGLGDSTLLKRHNLGFYQEAANQFLLWDKQKGKRLGGLTRRRQMERAIYLGDAEGYRGNV